MEVEFVGVACGIMDRFASALGRRGAALHLWCDSGHAEWVPMTEGVLIFDTAIQRSLRGSAFDTRPRQTLGWRTPAQVLEATLEAPVASTG